MFLKDLYNIVPKIGGLDFLCLLLFLLLNLVPENDYSSFINEPKIDEISINGFGYS